jgi:hypothetical protein
MFTVHEFPCVPNQRPPACQASDVNHAEFAGGNVPM